MSNPAPADDLLERADEMVAIARAVAGAPRGEGSVLVLEGPAGIGKTRLLDAARRAADGQGIRVFTARGGDLERDFAYGVVRQLFERALTQTAEATRAALLAGAAAHAAAAVGLEAAPGEPVAEDQGFAVRHGLYWLVSNLAADGPLLLAIDDAHWADAPSLRFLAYLAHRLDGLPVLLALTAPVIANAPRVAELGPRTVARSLVLRLGRVSPAAVGFARAVAVLGTRADPRHAAALAGLGEADARTSYDTLATA